MFFGLFACKKLYCGCNTNCIRPFPLASLWWVENDFYSSFFGIIWIFVESDNNGRLEVFGNIDRKWLITSHNGVQDMTILFFLLQALLFTYVHLRHDWKCEFRNVSLLSLLYVGIHGLFFSFAWTLVALQSFYCGVALLDFHAGCILFFWELLCGDKNHMLLIKERCFNFLSSFSSTNEKF